MKSGYDVFFPFSRCVGGVFVIFEGVWTVAKGLEYGYLKPYSAIFVLLSHLGYFSFSLVSLSNGVPKELRGGRSGVGVGSTGVLNGGAQIQRRWPC